MRALVITLVLCGCGRLGFEPFAESFDVRTPADAMALDASEDASDIPTDDGALSPDAMTDASVEAGDGGETCLPWSRTFVFNPRLIEELSTPEKEEKPRLTRDGLTLYFAASGRPDTLGGLDLYEARRPALGEPFVFVGHVDFASSASDDDALVVTSDEREAYLSTDWPGGMAPGRDVWFARRASSGDAFDTFVPLTSVNELEDDNDPFVSANGLHLYFATERVDAAHDHLAMARRDDRQDDFADPVILMELAADGISRGNPTLSDDERLILFNDIDVVSVAMYATRLDATGPFGTPAIVPGLPEMITSPALSRDGCEIVYAFQDDLYIAEYQARR